MEEKARAHSPRTHQAAVDVLQVHQLDGHDLVKGLAPGAPDLGIHGRREEE
jgi:hypothetical protein